MSAATDITLSASTVTEGLLTGAVVAAITVVGSDPVYTLSLPDDADGTFAISGTDLVIADGSKLDRLKGVVVSVTIAATDVSLAEFSKPLSLSVLVDPDASMVTFIDPLPSRYKTTQVITVKGKNFTVGGNPTVKIGIQTLTQLSTSNTKLVCLVPVLDLGAYTVTVLNGMGK